MPLQTVSRGEFNTLQRLVRSLVGGVVGTPSAHATSHEDGGSDPIDVTQLDGYPGGTTTFLRADAAFAAPPSSTDARYIPACKTSNETVNNSSTLQNDNELLFAAEANATYLVEVHLMLTATSVNADWKMSWSLPSGTFYWGHDGNSAEGPGPYWSPRSTASGSGAALVSTSIVSGGGTLTPMGAHFTAIIVIGGSGGTVNFQWAQDVATAENNTILAGSCLRAFKVSA
jgi:hypothetical protein